MKQILAAALSLAAAAPAVQAQSAAYRPAADTVYVQALNAYRMFVVRGADTLGGPVTNLYVERQSWADQGGRLRMVARRSDLDLRREVREDTYVVSPLGTVETINGEAKAPRGQYDAFPRLPAGGSLAPGTAWSDTVSHTRPAEAGDYAYTVVRSYRVAGPAPDGRGVRLEATGEVRYRDVYPAGDAGHWWIDVRGPMTAVYTFDPAEGRLRGQEWRMELRGTAGIPRDGGRVDTIPAGLVSSMVQRPVDAALARRLTRDLPGADSSVTSSQVGPMLLHTVARGEGGTIESGMARADGLVGTARTQAPQGAFRRYQAVWTDSAGTAELVVEQRGRRHLQVSGTREEMVDLPPSEAFWAVADYGMEEHLAPALLALPEGASRIPFAVYRPHAARWDAYNATVGNVNGARLVTLSDESGGTQHLLFTPEGDLLVNQRAGHGERRPVPGSRRAERLEDLLAAVKGARGEPVLQR